MSFYIKPPRGSISLAKFNNFAKIRLDFLLEIQAAHGNLHRIRSLVENAALVADSDCLIEGTKKDRISHFILRLASGESDEVDTFLHDAEKSLFRFRVSCMTSRELHHAIRPLRKLMTQLRSMLENGEVISTEMMQLLELMTHVTASASWDDVVTGFVDADSSQHVKVPFHYVTDLVARRNVVVRQGLAEVPFSHLQHILHTAFSITLKHGLKVVAAAKAGGITDDGRVNNLIKYVKAMVHKRFTSGLPPSTSGHVTTEDVESFRDVLPPCMRHLQERLQEDHRLPHASRIQYTLFLKEIGLPLSEALRLWERHYSQPPGGADITYGHSWRTDGRRYTYSIRHLYGLEGARRNYRAHCCASIQEYTPSHGQPGGCPFKHFDVTHLRGFLSKTVDDVTRVQAMLRMCADDRYGDACKIYLLHLANKQLRHSLKEAMPSRSEVDELNCGNHCQDNCEAVVGSESSAVSKSTGCRQVPCDDKYRESTSTVRGYCLKRRHRNQPIFTKRRRYTGVVGNGPRGITREARVCRSANRTPRCSHVDTANVLDPGHVCSGLETRTEGNRCAACSDEISYRIGYRISYRSGLTQHGGLRDVEETLTCLSRKDRCYGTDYLTAYRCDAKRCRGARETSSDNGHYGAKSSQNSVCGGQTNSEASQRTLRNLVNASSSSVTENESNSHKKESLKNAVPEVYLNAVRANCAHNEQFVCESEQSESTICESGYNSMLSSQVLGNVKVTCDCPVSDVTLTPTSDIKKQSNPQNGNEDENQQGSFHMEGEGGLICEGCGEGGLICEGCGEGGLICEGCGEEECCPNSQPNRQGRGWNTLVSSGRRIGSRGRGEWAGGTGVKSKADINPGHDGDLCRSVRINKPVHFFESYQDLVNQLRACSEAGS